MTSLHRSTHSTQMPPCSPRISFGTCSLDLPHSTQRRISSRSIVDLGKVALLQGEATVDRRVPAERVMATDIARHCRLSTVDCRLTTSILLLLGQLLAGHHFVDEAVGD